MDVLLGKRTGRNSDESVRLKQACQPILALLRKVAWGGVGSAFPVLKRLYSLIRSVLDYSASTITRLNKRKAKALEVIQSHAIRIISDWPKSTQQECARYQVELPPLVHRVQQVATV